MQAEADSLQASHAAKVRRLELQVMSLETQLVTAAKAAVLARLGGSDGDPTSPRAMALGGSDLPVLGAEMLGAPDQVSPIQCCRGW